jgi:hypothetical protein
MFKVILLASAALTGGAQAADMKYCDIWAKEVVKVTVDMSPIPEVQASLKAHQTAIYNAVYNQCVVVEADPEWELTMQAKLDGIGSEPATEKKLEFEEGWVARCKRDYRSFRESDGTVIRRGSKKRTLCPL